jgi:hypothetical protein
MMKAKNVDYRITRYAEDTDLQDDDFAFVFNSKGEIRAVQMSASAEDDDPLPYTVEKMIEVIGDLELITKLTRTYH